MLHTRPTSPAASRAITPDSVKPRAYASSGCAWPWMGSLSFLLLAGIGACGGSSSFSTQWPHFDESFCPFVVDSSQVQGRPSLGVLYTPEVHATPSRYIQVPVLIFKGRGVTAPPVVNLSGGPGQSWAGLGLEQITASDIQCCRWTWSSSSSGHGPSRPRLDCPAQGSSRVATPPLPSVARRSCSSRAPTSPPTTSKSRPRTSPPSSRARLPEDALDGVSYGTAWRLQILRARQLDAQLCAPRSVVNPSTRLSASATATDAAFAAAFTAARRTARAAAYGDVKSHMEAALASLKAKALTLAGAPPLRAKPCFEGAFRHPGHDSLPVAAHDRRGLGGHRQRHRPVLTTATSAPSSASTRKALGIPWGRLSGSAPTANRDRQSEQSDLAKVNPAFSTYLDESAPHLPAWKYQQRSVSDYSAVTSSVTSCCVRLVDAHVDPARPDPLSK